MEAAAVFGDVIYAYTRDQAIKDGVLVDVSQVAQEAGFVFPVAVTRRVWDEIITPPVSVKELGQSEGGRLWDVLWMLRVAIKKDKTQGSHIRYQLIVQNDFEHDLEDPRYLVTLKSLCHGGDDREPVITIMMPDED